MDLELGHLIVFTNPGAPVVDRLEQAGFRAGTTNDHPGQGTANRRVFFANAYLEFLFVTGPGPWHPHWSCAPAWALDDRLNEFKPHLERITEQAAPARGR